MKRNRTIAIALVLAAPVVICGAIAANDAAHDWFKFHVFYRDYLVWKNNGGRFQPKFYEPLQLDRHRDDAVAGLTYEQVRAKFASLVDGDDFSVNSYRGDYLRNARKAHPELKVLWLTPDDDFGWCIAVDRSGTKLRLIKG